MATTERPHERPTKIAPELKIVFAAVIFILVFVAGAVALDMRDRRIQGDAFCYRVVTRWARVAKVTPSQDEWLWESYGDVAVPKYLEALACLNRATP